MTVMVTVQMSLEPFQPSRTVLVLWELLQKQALLLLVCSMIKDVTRGDLVSATQASVNGGSKVINMSLGGGRWPVKC